MQFKKRCSWTDNENCWDKWYNAVVQAAYHDIDAYLGVGTKFIITEAEGSP